MASQGKWRLGRRRCYFFDDNGEERARKDGVWGCENPRCGFAHPDDPEWATATPSTMPLHLMPLQERTSMRAENDRGRSPSRTRSSRQDSPTRPPLSSTTNRSAPIAPRAALRKESTESLNTRGREREQSSRDRTPPASGPSADPSERSRADATSRRSLDQGRREGSQAATSHPMPPPMPPPSVAKTPAPSVTVRKELTKEEKMDAWVQRIKSLADAVLMRTEYVKIEQDIVQFKRMQNTPRYHEISEQTKAGLNAQLTALESQWDTKKKDLNLALYRLIDADFWPVASATAGSAPSEDKFRDLRVTVWELRDNVQKLYRLVQARNEAAPSLASATTSDTLAEDRPPTKRRRIVEDEPQAAQTSTPQVPLSAAAPVPQVTPPPVQPATPSKDLESVNERYEELESRINTLENDMVQYDNDLLMQVEEHLENRLATLQIQPGSSTIEPDAEKPPDTGQVVAEKLQQLQYDVESVGEDMSALVGEVASLITSSEEMGKEVRALKEEKETMQSRITALEKEQEETRVALQGQRAELDALNAALSTFVSQQQVPPALAQPDINMLLEILGPLVSQNARRNIEPLLAETQSHVEQILDAHSHDLSENVLPKVLTTLKTVQTIKAWMESIIRTAPTAVPNVNAVPAMNLIPYPHANGVHVPAGVRTSVPTLGTDRISVVPKK